MATSRQRRTQRAKLTVRQLGNRQHSAPDAGQPEQSLAARRPPRRPARQDGQPGDVGAGLPPWCQPRAQADVVEGHEDADLHHRRHHHPVDCHHRAFR